MDVFGVQISRIDILSNQPFEFLTRLIGYSASFRIVFRLARKTTCLWVRGIEPRQRLPAERRPLEFVGIASPDEPHAILGDNKGKRRIRFALHARMDCFTSCLNLEWPRLFAGSKHNWCAERLSVAFARSACVCVYISP